MDDAKFTRKQIVEILNGMIDNLEFLRDTIVMHGDPSFDFSVASVFANHKFYPLMEYLDSTNGNPFSDGIPFSD